MSFQARPRGIDMGVSPEFDLAITQPERQLDSSRAWLACGLGLVALFAAFGLFYSYGVFFSSIIVEFDVGRGQGALFFSVASFLTFGLACVTGPLCDRIGPRPLLISGGLLIGAGLWLTAHAHSLAGAYISYGMGVGVGCSCIFVPVVTAVGRWFDARRTLALGIAVAGIGLGTLAVAPLSAILIESYGWRRAYEIYAVAGAAIIVIAGVLFPRPPPPSDNTARRCERLFSRRYVHLYLATLLLNLVLYVPFVHLPSAAEAAGVPRIQAAGLVAVLGIASVVGRLVAGLIGDRLGQIRLYRLCFLIVSLSFFIWAFAGSYAMFLVFAIVAGLGYGGYIALTPAVLASVFGPEDLGRRLGTTYTAAALGIAIGPLVVGVGVEILHGYTVVLAVLATVSLLSLVPLRAISEVKA